MARRKERGATPQRRRPTKGASSRPGEPAKRPQPGSPKLTRKLGSTRSGRPPPAPLLYLLQHFLAAWSALARLRKAPVHSALTTAVIGIAIALPAAFWLVLDNLEQATGGWEQGAPQISLFAERTTSKDRLEQMAARVERDNRVANVEIITPEQALAEFRTQSGLEAALGLLEENPLPAVLSVTVSSDLTPQQVGALADELAQRANIQRMRLDHEWVERLHALMNLAERALGVLAALLAVAVVLVIGNTIRLTIENRREEIEIIKLIGGSNGFVRRPFLYEGFWYGFSGGALAWLLTEWGRWSIKQPAQRLAHTYGGELTLHGIGLNDTLVLLGGGGMLGVLGAWVAVARHLTAIEPR